MPDFPDSKRPRRRAATLTAEQLVEVEQRYFAGQDVSEIAAALGTRDKAVKDARDRGGWAQTRAAVLAARAEGAVRVEKSKADQQAEVNRRQGEIAKSVLDLYESAAKVIKDANEQDPDKARATVRAFGGLRGPAEVQRLSVDLHTLKIEGDSALTDALTTVREVLRKKYGITTDGSDGGATGDNPAEAPPDRSP